MTMMMLGGMMGPTREDAAVTAAAKGLSYPCLVMAGTSMEPRAATSDTAAPEIPANRKLPRILA